MTRTLVSLVIAALLASASACTIDPVARAELSGAAAGDAIFQQSGTSDQVSFEISIVGVDGAYDLRIADGTCHAASAGYALGTLTMEDGNGRLRGVTTQLEVGTGSDRDVVGRNLVVEHTAGLASCGLIFNAD